MTEQVDANVSTTEQQQPVAPAADAAPTQQAEKTFTQAEVNAIMADLKRKHREQYQDYEQLKQSAAKLQELEDAQKTEQEKLQEQLERLKAEYETERSKRREVSLKSRVANIAGSLGAYDISDANFIVATSAIDPDGDGADDEIKKKLEEIKAAKPYLFGKGQRLEAFNPAEGGGAGAGETPAQRRNRIAGGGGMIWDSDPAKHGGGVIFNPGWDKTS